MTFTQTRDRTTVISYTRHLETRVVATKRTFSFSTPMMLVAGDNPPIYANDTKTAKPIISYNGRQTWNIGSAIPLKSQNR